MLLIDYMACVGRKGTSVTELNSCLDYKCKVSNKSWSITTWLFLVIRSWLQSRNILVIDCYIKTLILSLNAFLNCLTTQHKASNYQETKTLMLVYVVTFSISLVLMFCFLCFGTQFSWKNTWPLINRFLKVSLKLCSQIVIIFYSFAAFAVS